MRYFGLFLRFPRTCLWLTMTVLVLLPRLLANLYNVCVLQVSMGEDGYRAAVKGIMDTAKVTTVL